MRSTLSRDDSVEAQCELCNKPYCWVCLPEHPCMLDLAPNRYPQDMPRKQSPQEARVANAKRAASANSDQGRSIASKSSASGCAKAAAPKPRAKATGAAGGRASGPGVAQARPLGDVPARLTEEVPDGSAHAEPVVELQEVEACRACEEVDDGVYVPALSIFVRSLALR